MSTDEYEAITEAEWKVLATTETTHLTDEEKEHLPRAWDEWIARVRRDAAREALDGLAKRFEAMGDGADMADQWAWEWHAQEEVEEYRDQNYPTPEEAP